MAHWKWWYGPGSPKHAAGFLDWEQPRGSAILSERSLIGIVAILAGMNLWFDLVILYLNMDRISSLL